MGTLASDGWHGIESRRNDAAKNRNMSMGTTYVMFDGWVSMWAGMGVQKHGQICHMPHAYLHFVFICVVPAEFELFADLRVVHEHMP